MNIIAAVILGIIIIILIILSITHFNMNRIEDFEIGEFVGISITILIFIKAVLVVDIISIPKPSALDVYRGNTELEITSVNGIPIDTVVVFKKK